jgi:hypothetical protein
MCRFPKKRGAKGLSNFGPRPILRLIMAKPQTGHTKKREPKSSEVLTSDKSGRFLKKKLGNFCAILSSVETTKIYILAPNFRYKKIDYKKNLSLIKLHLNLWFLFITNINFLAVRSAGVTLPSRHRRSPN